VSRAAFEVSGLLNDQPSGVGIYGQGLLRALGEVGESRDSIGLIAPIQRWGKRQHLREFNLRIVPYLTGSFLSSSFSILHLLDTRMPKLYRGPLVATIFDVVNALSISADLGFAPDRFRQRKLRAYQRIAARADAVVTLSDSVRRSFLELFPKARRVEVIPPGVDAPTATSSPPPVETCLAVRGIEPPYVLGVGALCPRKNLGATLRAFESALRVQPRLRLVLVGAPAYGWEGSKAEATARRLASHVVFTGYVPRDVLWAAITHAECLLQLSHYEGYGFPVLEALAVGTPVVASRRGGIEEAAGGAAWLVDPQDESQVDGALRSVLDGAPEVRTKCAVGRQHARVSTWKAAAAAVLRLHGEILDDHRKNA